MEKKRDFLGLAFAVGAAALAGIAYVCGKRTGESHTYADVADKITAVASTIGGKTETAE